MRKWMWMAVSVGLAAAQEPPKAPPGDQPKAEQKAPEPEKKPAQGQPKWFEALDRALRRSWQAKTPAPRGPCAIPLLNVAPGAPAGKLDPMIIPVPKEPIFSKEEVKVPAPSCDDVKGDDQKK